MIETRNLLVELFSEELPPKALRRLGEAFGGAIGESLRAQGLANAASVITPYASPRRLAVHVTAVRAQGADKAVSQKLMPASVGLTATGQASPALLKKLASIGSDASAVPQLKRRLDGKAETLFFESTVGGTILAVALQKALDEALASLPIPKVMQYQLADGWTTVRFVRPVHGLVALYGSEVVAVGALGLAAGRVTRGHRFEAQKEPIELTDADHYSGQLESEGAVIARFDARRDELERQLRAAAAAEQLTTVDDPLLLEEVAALVERPNVLLCRFDAQFLEVPQECLILTMKANQKYFPLLDASGKLTARFLVVSNIRPPDPRRVIEGNERVVRARLADAKFFFDQDRKRTLRSRVAGLDKVVYHGQLGTQGERTERVRSIARALAKRLGGDALAGQADRASWLAKADLLTGMVGEFPQLQGVMGGYYARHDGEAEDVAFAIEDHYKPRFAGDELPRNLVGVVTALADKLETLAGLFGIGQFPTGDKDPFALRRTALGVLRLLIERGLELDSSMMLGLASEALAGKAADASAEIGLFLRDRLTVMFRDQGYSAAEVSAVLDLGLPEQIWLVPKRLAAVRAFASLAEAASLAGANKRVANLLKKAGQEGHAPVDASSLKEPAEIALNAALAEATPKADAAFARGDYAASLQALAALKSPVDAFFDSVMVNVEDPGLRANRLGLLAMLHTAMNRVADLSKLAA